jgi:hypothetical protein
MWRTPKNEISILSSVITTDPEKTCEAVAILDPKETTAAILMIADVE